jgi:hypothetical protein
VKKQLELKVTAQAFVPQGNPEETEQAEQGVKTLFGIEDMNEEVTLTLSLEDFLWYVLQVLPAPETPLKIAVHKKILEEAALALSETQNTEDLPVLSSSLLSHIHPYLNDEALFDSLVKCPFIAMNKKDATQNRFIELPAKNLIRDLEFVETLAKVFQSAETRLV